MLILFDIDGTLTATGGVDGPCFKIAFERVFGLPLPTTDWHAYLNVTDTGIIKEVLEKAGRPLGDGEIALFEKEYLRELRQASERDPLAFTEIPGARAILAAIRDREGISMALATGGMRATATFKLSRIGVDARSMAGAYSNDSDTRAGIASAAIERADADGSDIVYVGDGLWDFQTASALGMGFVGITHESEETRLRAAGARVLLRDYTSPETFFEAVLSAAESARGNQTQGSDS